MPWDVSLIWRYEPLLHMCKYLFINYMTKAKVACGGNTLNPGREALGPMRPEGHHLNNKPVDYGS